MRMSRQREEADPMPKKRAKGSPGSEWDKPSLLQDMGILGEVRAPPRRTAHSRPPILP